jgi:hypothetical protein
LVSLRSAFSKCILTLIFLVLFAVIGPPVRQIVPDFGRELSKEKVTHEGLIELCKQRMAHARDSRRIELMEESPKRSTGKFLF